jgi:hypothetical protein
MSNIYLSTFFILIFGTKTNAKIILVLLVNPRVNIGPKV